MDITRERESSPRVAGQRDWDRLSELEERHREIQQRHEELLRNLDQASIAAAAAERRELLAAWNQYKEVVADLTRVTEEMESLRLSMG